MLLVSKTLYPPGEPPVVQIPSAAPNLFSVDPHLHAKLANTEKLWKQAVTDRKTMGDACGERPFPDGYIYPYNSWDFTPPSFFCPHDLERVGSLGDGGKVFCGMSRYERESLGPSSAANGAPELIVYTFGISGDSSFEAALLERTNALIWGYDFSVNRWAKDISEQQARRTRFQKVAIGKETDETGNPAVRSIQDLIKENGHSYIDLIRMGIEGAEFDFISSFIASVVASQGGSGAENNATLPAGQLLMELHFMKAPPSLTIPRDLDSWMRWFAEMETVGSRPVNNEDNWIGDVGTGKPRFMEVR
jgi:hypothetical protein